METELWQIVQIKPTSFGSIVSTSSLTHLGLRNTNRKCCINNLHTRVKIVAVCLNLFKLRRIQIQTGFFTQFSSCAIIQIFIILFKKTPWSAPIILIWEIATPNQQYLLSIIRNCIGRNTRFTPTILGLLDSILRKELLFLLFIVRTILEIQFMFLNVTEGLVSYQILNLFVMTIRVTEQNFSSCRRRNTTGITSRLERNIRVNMFRKDNFFGIVSVENDKFVLL